jgi:ankyrin repeat protein
MQQVLGSLLQAELDCADIHEAVSKGHVCCLQFFTSRHDAISADFKQQTPFRLIDHRTAPLCHELTSTLLAALSSEAATTLVNTADARGNTGLHGTAGCKLADDGTVINDCYDGNLIVCHTCIRALLAVGADPTIKNKAGVQAVSIPEVLSVARRDEDLDILDEYLVTVKALQQAGLDINVTHYKGQTEYHLHGAAGHGYRYQCESTVRLLLDCGADVLLHDSDDWTAMQRAAYWESERGIDGEKEGNDEIIQMLYDAGGHDQLFGTLADGQTLPHLASIWPDSMQKLCELGALVDARSDDMQTPLHSASASGNSDTIRVLLDSGANIHAYGDSKTDMQAYSGSKSNYEGTGSWQPIHFAVLLNCYTDVVDTLLEAGATIDAKTTAGCTAAWLVARYSSAQGMYCPEEYNICSVAQQLEQVLSRGADLMHYSDHHGSLLHAAAGNGDVDVMNMLL